MLSKYLICKTISFIFSMMTNIEYHFTHLFLQIIDIFNIELKITMSLFLSILLTYRKMKVILILIMISID